MLSRFRLSPAMVVAVIALLVSLGGTAYAVGTSSSPTGQTFSTTIPATDNAPDTPAHLLTTPLGQLNANCKDLNTEAGIVNPRARILFQNTSGSTENDARTISGGSPGVIALANGARDSFVGFDNTFELLIDQGGTELTVTGALRGDGAGTSTGSCTIWGTTELQNK
jgi:hypothetical protein